MKLEVAILKIIVHSIAIAMNNNTEKKVSACAFRAFFYACIQGWQGCAKIVSMYEH